MQMPDVNVLVYAHREEAHSHARYAAWLTALVTGSEPSAYPNWYFMASFAW
jgi:predicted nucleic acid-binding protein